MKNLVKIDKLQQEVDIALNEESMGYIKVLYNKGYSVSLHLDRYVRNTYYTDNVDIATIKKKFRKKIVWVARANGLYIAGRTWESDPNPYMEREDEAEILPGLDTNVNKAVFELFMNVMSNKPAFTD